jgi:hypothetical protein
MTQRKTPINEASLKAIEFIKKDTKSLELPYFAIYRKSENVYILEYMAGKNPVPSAFSYDLHFNGKCERVYSIEDIEKFGV